MSVHLSLPEPRIGVVVPTLNSEATLDWTLCSLTSQRGLGADVVVADSGSQDATLEICKRWAVRTIYVPPGNMYRAINVGLRESKAEWLTYLNSDDLVYPDAYARLVALGEERNASLVYGDCDYVDCKGRFLFSLKAPGSRRIRGVLRGGLTGFAQPAAIFRKSVYEELRGFDEHYRHIADYDFFYRLAFSGHALAKLQAPPVACFRIHATQLSVREVAVVRAELKSFREAQNIKPPYEGFYDTLCWRLQNFPLYLRRLVRYGRIRQSRILQRENRMARVGIGNEASRTPES